MTLSPGKEVNDVGIRIVLAFVPTNLIKGK
jgi:hypothetical protein